MAGNRQFASTVVGTLEEQAEAEHFFDATQKNTSSNGWVTYDTYTTDEIKTEGYFILDWSIDYTNSDKEKRVGISLQWKKDSSGSWITLSDIRHTVGYDNAYSTETNFSRFSMTGDDLMDFRVQWGQTDDGGTGRIRNITLYIKRVGDL